MPAAQKIINPLKPLRPRPDESTAGLRIIRTGSENPRLSFSESIFPGSHKITRIKNRSP